MNTLNTWEAQTLELIRLIEQEISEAENHLSSLMEQRNTMVEALQTYKERLGSEYSLDVRKIKPQEFDGKSTRDILRIIAERNNKTLVAKNAIRIMKDADIFGNPLNADSVVYSVLSRSPEFIKVGRGIYRLNGEHKEGKSVRKERIPGLKQAINELKNANSNMTKVEVRDTLIKRGFDFKGRNPNKAVHMLWVNLGYTKKDKEAQQNLL